MKNRLELLEKVTKNGIIAELGVFNGNYSQKILEICKPRELHLIDKWEGKQSSYIDNWVDTTKGFYLTIEDMFSEYIKLGRKYRNDSRVYLHRGDDLSILDVFGDSYFDMVYIDTTHTYNQTLKELFASDRVTKDNGFIMGHDYNIEGVFKAVKEFCFTSNYVVEDVTCEVAISFCIKKS